MKKKIEKKSAQAKTIDQLSTAETIQHYNAVLIEELKSEFRAVAEGAAGAEERTRQLIEELRKENQEEHDDIKFILRRHSEMFEEMDPRFNKVDERFEKVDERFDRLEEKVDGLEVKMTEVVDAVQHHEKEIQELKKAV